MTSSLGFLIFFYTETATVGSQMEVLALEVGRGGVETV
jgi:hypothetical protein